MGRAIPKWEGLIPTGGKKGVELGNTEVTRGKKKKSRKTHTGGTRKWFLRSRGKKTLKGDQNREVKRSEN